MKQHQVAALTDPEQLLIRARSAAQRAHCTYSNFRVGATVLCADGSVVDGCNVENASYGLSICAERVALTSALAQGKRPTSLAVSCIDASDETDDQADTAALRMPCGACRQVMLELLPSDAEIHIDGVGSRRLAALIPQGFRLS